MCVRVCVSVRVCSVTLGVLIYPLLCLSLLSSSLPAGIIALVLPGPEVLVDASAVIDLALSMVLPVRVGAEIIVDFAQGHVMKDDADLLTRETAETVDAGQVRVRF